MKRPDPAGGELDGFYLIFWQAPSSLHRDRRNLNLPRLLSVEAEGDLADGLPAAIAHLIDDRADPGLQLGIVLPRRPGKRSALLLRVQIVPD